MTASPLAKAQKDFVTFLKEMLGIHKSMQKSDNVYHQNVLMTSNEKSDTLEVTFLLKDTHDKVLFSLVRIPIFSELYLLSIEDNGKTVFRTYIRNFEKEFVTKYFVFAKDEEDTITIGVGDAKAVGKTSEKNKKNENHATKDYLVNLKELHAKYVANNCYNLVL